MQGEERISLQRHEYHLKGLLRGSETTEKLRCLANHCHRGKARVHTVIIIFKLWHGITSGRNFVFIMTQRPRAFSPASVAKEKAPVLKPRPLGAQCKSPRSNRAMNSLKPGWKRGWQMEARLPKGCADWAHMGSQKSWPRAHPSCFPQVRLA